MRKRKICDKEALGQLEEDTFTFDIYSDFSLSMEYSETGLAEICDSQRNKELDSNAPKTYLQCSSSLTISILKKFLAMKQGLKPSEMKTRLDVMYDDRPLSEELTLLDVAYIYAWRRTAPMRLFYRIAKSAEGDRNEKENVNPVNHTLGSSCGAKPVLASIDNRMSGDFNDSTIRQETATAKNSDSPDKKQLEKFSRNNENCMLEKKIKNLKFNRGATLTIFFQGFFF